jgi:hypothetical protein
MPRGGWRPNSGRKKGSVNKNSRRIAEEAARTGRSPLAYLLSIVHDESQPTPLRCEMAVACLPFCHAKIGSIDPPDQPETPRASTIVNVIAYPSGTQIGRDGVVRLPAPAIDGEVIEETEPPSRRGGSRTDQP